MNLNNTQNISCDTRFLTQEKTLQNALAPQQALEKACEIFKVYTNADTLQKLATLLLLSTDKKSCSETLLRLRQEWYGFIHASVLYAMMGRMTSKTMSQYIEVTREIMHDFESCNVPFELFMNETLTEYVEYLTNNEQQQCPTFFIHKVIGKGVDKQTSTQFLEAISGIMMTSLCDILDIFESYTYLQED